MRPIKRQVELPVGGFQSVEAHRARAIEAQRDQWQLITPDDYQDDDCLPGPAPIRAHKMVSTLSGREPSDSASNETTTEQTSSLAARASTLSTCLATQAPCTRSGFDPSEGASNEVTAPEQTPCLTRAAQEHF